MEILLRFLIIGSLITAVKFQQKRSETVSHNSDSRFRPLGISAPYWCILARKQEIFCRAFESHGGQWWTRIGIQNWTQNPKTPRSTERPNGDIFWFPAVRNPSKYLCEFRKNLEPESLKFRGLSYIKISTF